MHTRTLALVGVLVLGLMTSPSLAREPQVPQLINYQGIVTGPDGIPPATGDYALSISIYDKPVAAPCPDIQATNCARRIWGPQVFDGIRDKIGHGAQVAVVKGFFNVLLGPYDTNGNPIVRAFTSSQRFVEVTFDGEPMLPRQQVFSSPFALASMGEVPIGGIIMWTGKSSELPDNWVIAKGQTVADQESPLFGKTLPDLRRRFVRGATDDQAVGDEGGQDNKPPHSHKIDVEAIVASDSINRWWSRPLLCDDLNDDNECDYRGIDFSPWTDNSIMVDPDFYALTIPKTDGRQSHGHSVEIRESSAGSDRPHRDSSYDRENRPAFVALHYIVRIK